MFNDSEVEWQTSSNWLVGKGFRGFTCGLFNLVMVFLESLRPFCLGSCVALVLFFFLVLSLWE